MNNQTGTGTITPGTIGGGRIGTGYSPIPQLITGTNTDAGSGTSNGTSKGITGGAAADTINGVRTKLINVMIREQRYDVNIDNNDAALASTITIGNWQLEGHWIRQGSLSKRKLPSLKLKSLNFVKLPPYNAEAAWLFSRTKYVECLFAGFK